MAAKQQVQVHQQQRQQALVENRIRTSIRPRSGGKMRATPTRCAYLPTSLSLRLEEYDVIKCLAAFVFGRIVLAGRCAGGRGRRVR